MKTEKKMEKWEFFEWLSGYMGEKDMIVCVNEDIYMLFGCSFEYKSRYHTEGRYLLATWNKQTGLRTF